MSVRCNKNDRSPEESGFRPFFRMILLIVVIAALAAGWYGNQLVLSVVPENNLQAYRFPIHVGDEWYYIYIHSVQRTPCEEYFTIKGVNDMVMTHTIYQSYGVGLPCYPEDGKFTLTKDGHFLLEMNRPFKQVAFRTHEIPKQTLFINGQELPIYKLYPSGTLVIVTVTKRYQTWFQ